MIASRLRDAEAWTWSLLVLAVSRLELPGRVSASKEANGFFQASGENPFPRTRPAPKVCVVGLFGDRRAAAARSCARLPGRSGARDRADPAPTMPGLRALPGCRIQLPGPDCLFRRLSGQLNADKVGNIENLPIL